MKGFVFLQYYSEPLQQSCSDLDYFLLDNDVGIISHMSACDRGNEIVQKQVIKVDFDISKHSKFCFEGLVIEHYEFCIPLRGDKAVKDLERVLQQCMLREEPKHIGDSCMESPSELFNALFLIKHAQRIFSQ